LGSGVEDGAGAAVGDGQIRAAGETRASDCCGDGGPVSEKHAARRPAMRWGVVGRGICTGVVAVLMMGAVVGCGRPGGRTGGEARQQEIRQIGSTTVLPLAEKWHREFNKDHPEVSISVSGGGSGTGIKALIAGTAEIANSSRAIKPKEVEQARAAGVNPVEHVVAHDGIAVIVHPSNPVGELSVEHLSDIFSGVVTNWEMVGGPAEEIQVVSRDSASGTYEAFKDLVVTMQGKDRSRDYAAAALKQGSNQAVLALVSNTKAAIGYVGLGYVDESAKTLGVIPMGQREAVAPTADNVMSGEYPVSRALYCYTNGDPTGTVKQYLDWAKGSEGQAIVVELGFVPVGAK
jgi:phosphate transport system substrate-binding protein